MADDIIDIEEHNILDNPALRHIFPDITILKKEVIDFSDEGTDLVNENPTCGIQQAAEKYAAIVIDDDNETLPYSSRNPADEMVDVKLTASNTNVIDIGSKVTEPICTQTIEDNKCPILVPEETNKTLGRNTKEVLGPKFSENICRETVVSEKYPTIVIETIDIVSCLSTKPAYRVSGSKVTEPICTQANEDYKDPILVPEETNDNSGQNRKEVLGPKFTKNICRETVISEKYPTVVIDETNVTLPGLLYGQQAKQVLDVKLTESNLKEIVPVPEKYPAKFNHKINVTFPCFSNKSANQVSVKCSQVIDKHKIYLTKKKYKKYQKTGCDIVKNIILQYKGSEFLLNSENITCNINEKKSKLPKSFSTTDKLPIKNPVNLDKNVPEYSEPDANRKSLRVISSPQTDLNHADKTTVDQKMWIGNKIILGSKSSAIKYLHKACEKQNNKQLKVLVENLGTFLSKSSRYCKTCLILFPSNKTLADHRNLVNCQVINNKLSACKKVKPNKEYKCNICGVVFDSLGNLLKHKRCVHLLTIIQRKRKANLNLNHTQPHSKLNEETNFTCNHCNRKFSSQQTLIDHMYNVLQSKPIKNDLKSTGNVKLDKGKINSKSQVFYRCPFCSYYLKQKNGYVKHVKNIHKADKINLEKVAFNPVCKYCSNKYSSVNSFNAHIWKHHQKQVKMSRELPVVKDHKARKITKRNIETQPKLKVMNDTSKGKADKDEKNCKKYLLTSVFFKCVKCNVCFLSGKEAANHNGHENSVTDWKCSKCSHIFIKTDQDPHTQQHLISNSFEVIEICEKTYLNLLFKCPNCTSYFREKDFFYHYSVCEMQSPESAYCKICHILIDDKIKQLHEIHHKKAGGKELNNILVETDIISRYDVNDKKLKDPIDLHKKLEDTDLSITCHEKADDQKQKKLNIADGRLKEKNVFNSDIDSNEEIEKKEPLVNTNLPGKSLKFMYCHTCKTFILVNRARKLHNHNKSRCLNLTNYVCKYCGLVLSNKTIESHRKLHQNIPNLTLSDFIFYDLKYCKKICPPVPNYPKCPLCKIHFITKTAIISHSCNEDYFMCHKCNIKLSRAAFSLHMSFHNYISKNKFKIFNATEDVSVHSKDSQPFCAINDSMKLMNSNRHREDEYLLVYICKICKVAVTTYDGVIEHCHYHISSQEKEILTKLCDLCNLVFDDMCFEIHKMLHSRTQNNKFSVLTFDAFYVTAEDKIWLNHLFGSLAQKLIDNILKKSIYKVERKIKMHVFQEGLSSDFTLYKCAKCNSFVEPAWLYKHCSLDFLCYKSKIVPCSVCGIILMSDEFLAKHKKIHESQNITVSSYRIVLFNCDDDKNINHILSMPRQYVLYECRNCSGIVDKKQFSYHKCDFEDLSKCEHCGLLLYSNDYMSHVLKHTEFCSFHEKNIIVILLGVVNDKETLKSRYNSSFRGVKLDYIVYKCIKCQICVKDRENSVKHKCTKVLAKPKCVPCNLYFEENFFKTHRKMHESDSYYLKDNITVIDLECPRSSDVDIIVIEGEENMQNNNGCNIINNKLNNISNVVDVCSEETMVEKYDELFKCLCDLHFLNEASALSHYNATKCNNRKRSKQTCPKCNLMFRPHILYNHLLKHHGSKNISYKFKITSILK